MRKIFLLGIPLGLLLTGAAANPEGPLVGLARAIDGDSLTVDDREVRLFGIDAPEHQQTCTRNGQDWACGEDAAGELAKLVTGRRVICIPLGVDQYRRVLGRCMEGATDVNSTMVTSGYAIAYRRYSSDYVAAEDIARLGKRGLWSGKFQLPSEYRHRDAAPAGARASRKRPGAAAHEWASRARSDCNIKGNRNRRGEWIYHLPGMPYYEQTRPEEIFCTEEEARAAGYRRAIVR